MKRFLKAVSVFMVFLMLLGSIAACKNDSKDPEKIAQDAYNALKTNADKLFHIVPVSHPSAQKVAGITGNGFDALSEIVGAIDSGKTVEADVKLDLNKLIIRDKDHLSQSGGAPVKFSGKLIANNEGADLGLTGLFSGIGINANVYADENALMVDCPLAFQKPFYIPNSAIPELLVEGAKLFLSGKVDDNVLNAVSAFYLWANDNLDKEELQHIAGLLKDAVPTNNITSEMVTVPQLKGDYITGDINAECITLILDAKGFDKLITNINNNVLTDGVFKKMLVSLIDALLENGTVLTEDISLDGESVYQQICKLFKDIVNSFDADDESVNITVKRYFTGGFAVKTDFDVKIKDELSVSVSVWNCYQGETAEYGVSVIANGNKLLDVSGGADKNNADLSFELNTYKVGVSVDDKGTAVAENKLENKFAFSASRNGDLFDLNGSIEAFSENANVVFACNENSADCTANITATIGGNTYKVTANADIAKKDSDGKYDISVKLEASSKGLLELSADFSFALDADSNAKLEGTKEEGSFIINGKHDLIYVERNINPVLQGLLGNKGESEPDEPEASGDISTDVGEDSSYDISYDESSEEITSETSENSVAA